MRSFENTFGRPATDRRTIERSNDEWISTQRASTNARFVVNIETRSLIDEKPSLVKLAREQLPQEWTQWQSVFLGVLDDAPLFAIRAPHDTEAYFRNFGEFSELRPMALLLPEADAAITAHMLAVFHWHALNQYCGACGHAMHSTGGGHARRCDDTACSVTEIYPRIDPAVIVLVTHEDRCLLGRQPAWPAGRYSCLAGFAEAGETLEEVVRREVFEESGVRVDNIEYHSSQPWPFPQSLMLGFRARAVSAEITLHDDELEDARWFTRENIREGIENGTLKASARLSIAWRLLRDWYAEDADATELDRLIG